MSSEQLVNGRSGNIISPDDRGLMYGDGLFETIAVIDGQPRYWDLHMDRLVTGSRRLGLPQPPLATLREEARYLVRHTQRGVIRIVYTRGGGEGRGYRPPARPLVTRVVGMLPPPASPPEYRDGVAVRTCETRLSIQPRLAGMKHLNRLEQVLARSEWSDSAIAEGLMLDHNGFLVEATAANVFAVRGDALVTPPLDESGVEGVIRRVVLDRAPAEGLTVELRRLYPEEVHQLDELFLTNSLIGVWPVREVDGVPIATGPVARRFMELTGPHTFAPLGN